MNENILDNGELLQESGVHDTFTLPFYTVSGSDGAESPVSSVSGGDGLSGVYGEDGLVKVVIVDDESEATALLSADTSSMGYQVSDYWLDYFRGVLQKLGNVDYCIFSTRERISGSGYDYVQHYYMYTAEDMGENKIESGTYTCYDAYSQNGIYYVDVSEEYLGNVETGKLLYSNIGNYSDIREGVSHYDSWALLFFLGFFAVYTVCHDIFDYIMGHVYRK